MATNTSESGRTLTPQEKRWVGAELRQTDEQVRFEKALELVRRMSADEVFQQSVQAGVHNPDGTLTDPYKP